MKGLRTILCAALCTACLSSMAVTGASASDELLYGTMNIPYDKFYANENVGYEVDAVSSATTSKWKNPNLVNGTYNAENTDGSGTILGVTYSVALTQETLNSLGSDNFNFTPTDSTPQAYKVVTKENDDVNFSAVVGESSQLNNVTATISTASSYGDYQISVDKINNNAGTSDIGTVYGVLLTTESGSSYAMRHLENIWRDEISWSSGIKTTESHGNTLSYENYVDLMGQIIDKITYITDTGYHTVDTSLYVPVKFNSTLEVAEANINASSTTFIEDGFPENYGKTYSVENLECTISENTINYSNAVPGEYTLTVSDTTGVYADVTTDFVLYTEELPVVFDGEKLVTADGYSESDFALYLNNISSVKVGETSYKARGKRSVKIIGEDGSIDLTATSNDTPIFSSGETYEITVTSTGYKNDLTFTLSTVAEIPTEQPTSNESTIPTEVSSVEATQSVTSATNTVNQTNATNATNSGTATTGTNNNTTSTTTGKTVNTGSADTVVPLVMLVMFGGAFVAFILRKRVTQ